VGLCGGKSGVEVDDRWVGLSAVEMKGRELGGIESGRGKLAIHGSSKVVFSEGGEDKCTMPGEWEDYSVGSF